MTPLHHIPGFTLRTVAQKQYGRSKASFSRDVDNAFKQEDHEFLSHFRVSLNDGATIVGPEATKEKIQSVQHLQPRVHIETAFLESRYWEKSKKENVKSSSTRSLVTTSATLDDATPVQQLQHELALEKERASAKDDTIEQLRRDKDFLQEELGNRRGEIDKLRQFFDSVGGAADSTAQLRDKSSENRVELKQSNTMAQTMVDVTPPSRSSFWEKYTPTLHQQLRRFFDTHDPS